MAEGVGCFALAWDPVSTANVYLAASNGLWASRDAGATWSLLKAGRFVSLVLDKSDPRRIYAAQVERSAPDAQNWLWRSLDGGTSWTVLSQGLPNPIGFTSLTICDAAPNVLYAGIDLSSTPDQPCIYKSVDGGDHWQALAAAPRYVYYPPPWVGCQGWYANVIAVSPRDPDVVFAGGIHLHRSVDGGATWSVSGGTYPDMVVHVDHHSFAYDPLDPTRVFSLNDGGVHRSDDLGDTWAPKNDGLVTFQYYAFATSPFRSTLISGGTQDNGTHLLDVAGGNSASRQWGPFADGGVSIFDHEREGVLHGEEQAGTHFKSVDGGATWRHAMNGINESGPWITPVAMSPADSDVLFTSSRSAIFRSTNGAESWQRVHDAAMITSIAIARDDPDVIYAGSFFEAALRRSLDGGQTWAPLPVPWVFGLSDLEADPFAPGVLYATMGSYSQRPRVFRSDDRGQTWASITGDLPVLPVNCITVAPGGALFVGTDLGVHRSTDGGVHWEPWNGTLPHVMVFDMHHVPADSSLRVATHGRGIWKVRLPPSPTVAVGGDLPATFALEEGVPNPFHASTRIGYRIGRAGHLRLAIHDVTGRRVRLLADGPEEAGSGSMSWDGHDDEGRPLPSGIYLLRMEAKAFPHVRAVSTWSRKLLKTR